MTYAAEVLADNPYRYFRLGGSGVIGDETGSGATVTVSAGVTRNVTGPLVADDDGAVQFDGIDDYGSVALDMSDTQTVSIEYWLWWDANASDDDFVMEFTANVNSDIGGWNVDQNNSTGGAETDHVSVNQRGPAGARRYSFPRPSAAAWHHYVLVLDRPANAISVYVDGASVTVAMHESSTLVGSFFANDTLHLMSRNDAALFGAGRLDELAIYKTALSAVRVAAHYAAKLDAATGSVIAGAVTAVAAGPAATVTAGDAATARAAHGGSSR